MSKDTALKIDGLTKAFGGIKAVENLSFELKTGEIMGIIGPNGAGKTTVFNLITSVYQPTEGNIYFEGQNITGKQPEEIVKLGIARTFQNIRLFKKLTVIENVITALDLNNPKYNVMQALFTNFPFVNNKIKKSEIELREEAKKYLRDVGIEEYAYKTAESLPYGLQRKLEIARALALNPRLLLLDEPAAGMNPEETRELTELIRTLAKKFDLSVLLIEHHMDLVMNLCDHLYVINFGKFLAEDTPEVIQNDPKVLEAYLGGGADA